MKTLLSAGLLMSLLTVAFLAQQRGIDDFFNDFTARWVEGNPNQATAVRYFTAEKQDRLERRLTPETLAYRKERIEWHARG